MYDLEDMRESDMVVELRRRLPEILPAKRVSWEAPQNGKELKADLSAHVSFPGYELRLIFELKSQPNLASLRNAIEYARRLRNEYRGWLPVLVSPHFNPEMRKLCKEHGQAFLDLSGNAWIQDGPILIDKEVAKNLFPHKAKRRSPFADKATLVLRYLLEQEDLAGRVREVSRALGLSPGYVSTILDSAVELGFARAEPDGRVRLTNLREMLLDWTSVYAWKKNEVRAYFGAFKSPDAISGELLRALRGKQDDYALTLHAGNNQVEPFAPFSVCHIYVRQPNLADHVASRLGLASVAPGAGNVAFFLPYYRESAFYGVRVLKGLSVASDLQLYLDLRRFPVRGEEASELIYERRLKPRWEKAGG